MTDAVEIDRAFVRIEEGLVHYRSCGEPSDKLPLYMMHASPTSSLNLISLMTGLGTDRRIIAPDTLGNGDSAPPTPDVPDMEYYADSVRRILDAMGLDKVDVYGSHTGAHIACELAIHHPDRVRKIIFDGIGLFSDDLKKDLITHYAPEIKPDYFGSQFNWSWHFLRDQIFHFPYFARDPEHQRQTSMPSPEMLHAMTVEVLKSVTTYHKGYRAAFRHPDRERLPLVKQPALCIASIDDPLHVGVEEAASLVPNAEGLVVGSPKGDLGTGSKVDEIRRFLDKG